MPTATTLSKRDYNKLLTDLRSIIREGKEEAERAATQALLESYWSIGQRIHKASQRHWHQHEDEFVYFLEGELVLVEDEPTQPYRFALGMLYICSVYGI